MLRDRIVCGINDPIIQRCLLSEKALSFKSAMERLAQGMESAAKNVRELNVPARNLPSSTATVTNAGQNPVNQVGDQAASRTPPIHVTDVGNLDIMPRLASTKKQFATNVEKLVTYRGSAGVNKRNHRNQSIMYRMMQQMSTRC